MVARSFRALVAPIVLAFSLVAAAAPPAMARESFADFLAALWVDAKAQGISRATFDGALRGVTPDPKVLALTKKQNEFVRPIWDYITNAVNGGRISRGGALSGQYASALNSARQKYGVDPAIVLGIWGMETNYGSFTGGMDVIRSLATLAHARYRDDFFRDELLAALRILERGEAERGTLKGSWAGAMGQTQFMPSSFEKHAVDFDGDGSKDIWSDPIDAIGSTAKYLADYGWIAGLPWGVEVALPQGLDLARAGGMRPFSTWAAEGMRAVAGGGLPRRGEAELFLPAGIRGPAFLVTQNYKTIKKYNSSDAYALAVAILADRIGGGEGVQGRWPKGEPQLSADERKEVQRRLKALGFGIDKIDGRFGEKSRAAVRAFQIKTGMVADGYADKSVLARLRGG